MKLSKDFLLHHNGEECLVVSTGNAAFAGLVRTNKTAARIWTVWRRALTGHRSLRI